MNFQTRFKQLLVSGCSFTHNNHPTTHCSWPNAMAHWGNMNITNLAIPGAGNAHVKNSILLHLEQVEIDIESTLIIVMWTGPERIDWITDQSSSNFSANYPFNYNYTNSNELVLGGNWWSNKANTHLTRTLVEYSKYQSNSSLALQSWIHMQDLENYLVVHGYNYYFTSWFDYSSTVDQSNRWIDFDKELNQLGLKRNLNKWITNQPEQHLGNWAVAHPEYLLEDRLHVSWQGHEAWLREILLPNLVQQKCIELI